MSAIILIVALFLAFSNGSNDNFKGVASIYGSKAASYRTALGWATIATLFGSLCSLATASRMVYTFSGRGLVPSEVAASPEFLAAAAFGAGSTVLLASRLGLPVSTTHALMGALVGAGWGAIGSGVKLFALAQGFLLPLLLSPVAATLLGLCVYGVAHWIRKGIGIERATCVCVGAQWLPLAAVAGLGTAIPSVRVQVDSSRACSERYIGRYFGIDLQSIVNALHFISAGAVSFARGLNDTPKIVAVLIASRAVGMHAGISLIACTIAVGGIVGARRVAETMSNKITTLNAGQGTMANLATAGLTLIASCFGLPVSTTHVSTGSLFGIGIATRSVRQSTLISILIAWVTTLPLGAALGGLTYFAFSWLK